MKMISMDRARKQADSRLNKIEKDISRVYKNNPAILSVEREYAKYMAMVKKRTKEAYEAYINEKDRDVKAEKKEAYMSQIKALTLESKEYAALVQKMAQALSKVNQAALDISNDAMIDVYVENYNQVAEECERVGIKVNGKE